MVGIAELDVVSAGARRPAANRRVADEAVEAAAAVLAAAAVGMRVARLAQASEPARLAFGTAGSRLVDAAAAVLGRRIAALATALNGPIAGRATARTAETATLTACTADSTRATGTAGTTGTAEAAARTTGAARATSGATGSPGPTRSAGAAGAPRTAGATDSASASARAAGAARTAGSTGSSHATCAATGPAGATLTTVSASPALSTCPGTSVVGTVGSIEPAVLDVMRIEAGVVADDGLEIEPIGVGSASTSERSQRDGSGQRAEAKQMRALHGLMVRAGRRARAAEMMLARRLRSNDVCVRNATPGASKANAREQCSRASWSRRALTGS